MNLKNGSCILGKAFHTGTSPSLSLPLFPSFSSTKDASRFKKKQQASRLSRSSVFSLSFFPVVPLPRGLLAKENPRTDASFSPRDLSFSRFFPPSLDAGSSRQVNAKVAVRCKSRAFPPWFARLEYLSSTIVVPSPQGPPATTSKGARVNIDNDGVLVFVRSDREYGCFSIAIQIKSINHSRPASYVKRVYHLSYLEL